ncbi:MAG: hypothetical protein M0Z56_01405 [Desulfobacteraceae bacterium]|nr:hypothetical protein [Desulfobacteraceae bacterium]
MTLRNVCIMIVCCTCLCASGCATILTCAFPKVKETKQGEKVSGDQVAYHYSLTETKDSLVLLRQPLCSQRIKITTVEKHQLHGVIPAMVEIPFFGLGIVDLVIAGTVSRATADEYDSGTIKSGEVIVCGNYTPAPNADLVIEFPESIGVSHLKTDANGKVLLAAIKGIQKKDFHYIIFVKEKDGVSYVKTIERNQISP